MKGDFSRLPLEPAAPATGVWMQQGRVQLDADWNEQVALSAERARVVARDAMGGSGAPARDPGFQVSLRSALRFDGCRTTAVVCDPGGTGFDPAAPFTLEVRAVVPGGCEGTLLDWDGRYALTLSTDGGLVFRVGRTPETPSPASASGGADRSPAAPGPAAADARDPSPAPGGVAGDADPPPAAGGTLAAPRALPPQRPAWVTVVVDGETACIYVDGEPAARGPLCPPAEACGYDAPLTLGGAVRDGVPRQVLNGVLLEARVWAVARTPAEVREGAVRSPGRGAPGLAAWWPLDEGHGGWARDASGNGLDAELGGSGTDAPRWLEPSLFIGAGRYWVEGVSCENDREVPWFLQPYLPRARAPRGDALVYLEAWDRYLSAAEEPSLREVALAGGDTTGRTRTVWQVRAVELPRGDGDDPPGEDHDPRREDWSRHLPASVGDGRLAARGEAATDNRLYRVEVRGGGGAYGWPRPAAARDEEAAVAEVDPSGGRVRLLSAADPDTWRQGGWVELFSRATDAAGREGTLHCVVAVQAGAEGSGPLLSLQPAPPPVPVADSPRVRPVATFVWSADNGSAAWAVQSLEAGGIAVLDDGGRAGVLPAQDDWVEATDDVHALRGIPGPLCRVLQVDEATLTVKLDPAPAGVCTDARRHPVLRRWDPARQPDTQCAAGTGPSGVRAEQLVCMGHWIPLDATVSVRFEGGGYRTGDWWTVPVREGAPGGVEWPSGPGGPRPLPPQGIIRRATPLALVRHRRGRAHVHDLRQVLTPAHAGDFVRRTGAEWMRGPLRIHDDLAVGGVIRGRLADGGVGTDALADRAVTHPKLADHAVHARNLAHGAVSWGALSDEVRQAIEALPPAVDPGDGAPAGAVVLTRSRVPPPGYTALDAALPLSALGLAWRAVDTLPMQDLSGAVCAVLEGAVYVLSGAGAEFWRWWPASGAWERLQAPGRHRDAALCAAAGRVFLLGGMNAADDPVPTVQAFDPAAGTWSLAAPMLTARAALGAAELDGWIYAVGGRTERLSLGQALAVVEAYDPVADRWERRRDMHMHRVHPGVAAAGGEVFAVGGASRVHLGEGRTATSESYDPASDGWTRRPRLPRARMQCAAAAAQDRLYVAGGREDDAPQTADARRFDAATNTWSRFPALPAALRGPSACIEDGVIYLVGGTGERGASNALMYACRLFTTLYAHARDG